VVEQEKQRDGIFVLLTTRDDLAISQVVDSYKNLVVLKNRCFH